MPARFRFRLQKVLELRERELEQKQLELARARADEFGASDALERARRERLDHDTRLRRVDASPVSPLELRARLATTEALTRREDAARRELEVARERTEAARVRAIEAHHGVEIVDRLRDRARSRWQAEIDAQERKILDDIQSRYGEDPLG
ncbi:MAG TPA: flagellar export protein FliJ [Candidatus Krumholzibacteria bacterium]|nr:flagellar export protein FliJ [Candidatus Krumholzibacteria bacterium]